MKKDIEVELENLQRLIIEMSDLIGRLSEKPNFFETRAAGSILHDFYCGVEKIFERIALSVDHKMPEGEDWHRQLLKQMTTPNEGIRKEVVKEDLFIELKEYLSFRHLFRHIYGFNLKWEQFSQLCYHLKDLTEKLKHSLIDFFKAI
ncbi:MAG: hypothetical protein NG747_05530 [Candidatus Brocadia sp.]|nr:hypothetical protein [Candidatus Brocadia sp.]